MIRGLPTTILSAVLAGAVGIGLFFVKHEVKEQEARLAELNHEIERSQEAIHVLKAEWSYLNDPARLRALSEKFLSMKVIGPAQVATLDTLPMAEPASGPVYAEAESPKPAKLAAAPTKTAVQVAAAKTAPVKQVAAKPATAPTHLAATPAYPAPARIAPPARAIVIQSPALASTPALPGETR